MVVFEDDHGGGDIPTIQYYLYDSKEKALDASILVMDKHSPWGYDWRNGIPGLGREDEDGYVGCVLKNVGKDGGTRISNEEADDRSRVEVSLMRLPVNPEVERPEEDDIQGDSQLVF